LDDGQVVNLKPESSLKVTIVHGDEYFAKSNPRIYNKLKQAGQSNILSRETEYSDDYNFYFNLDKIQIIEKASYTQYTVIVERDNSVNELLNYMLLEYDDGEQFQYLITYSKTQTENGLEINHNSATIENLDGQSLLARGFGNSDCLDGVPELVDSIQIYVCEEKKCSGSNHHSIGEVCPCGNYNEEGIYYSCSRANEECDWQTVNVWSCDGGSSGNGNNGGTSTGGGSHGGNDDDSTVDDPTNENDEENETLQTIALDDDSIANQKNCNELNDLTNHFAIKQQLIGLKSDAENENEENERGFSLRKDSQNQTYATPTITAEYGEISYLALLNIFGVAHTHPHQSNGANPMFSAMDAFALKKHNTAFSHDIAGTDESLSVYILVVATGTYAIKINDLEAIEAYAAQFPTKGKQKREHKRLNTDYNDHHNPTTGETGDINDFEQEFTQYIQSKGISSYKADDDLSGWNRLQYNEAEPNNIQTTNCNEN
jgi:hypothetical protein